MFFSTLVLIFCFLIFFYFLEKSIIFLLTGVNGKATPKSNLRQIINVLKPKEGELFCDLGFGDGELLYEFVKQKKTKAIGYEISIVKFLFTKLRLRLKKDNDDIRLIRGNFLKHDFLQADIIFCSLSKKMMKKIKNVLKEKQKRQLRILSENHPLPFLTPTNIYSFGRVYNLRKYYYYVINDKSF